MAKRSRAHYTDKIRDHILDALKAFDPATQVGLPWRQNSLPFNASTGRAYSGMNVFLLAVTLHRLGADASQGFLTSNQGRQFDGRVKKGEKGTCCLFYRKIKKRNQDTDEEESFAMARYFHVFHVSQFEGLDEQALLSPVREPVAFTQEGISVAPDTLDTLTRLVCEVDVPTSVGGGRAFYTPSRDAITMPCITRFPDPADWWRVWLHELVHATGAKKRLGRTFGTFGSPDYAFEELVAELGSAMMSMEVDLGALPGESPALEDDDLIQHLGYIRSWIRLLQDHERAFLEAWSLAASACDWIQQAASIRVRAERIDQAA